MFPIYITICKIDSQWEFAVLLRELKPGLCNNLEGWERVEDGRKVNKGGDRSIPTADWSWCMAEVNTIMQSNYPSIKNKKV